MASKSVPAPKVKILSTKIPSASAAAKPIVAKKVPKAAFPNTNTKFTPYKTPKPASVNPTVKGV